MGPIWPTTYLTHYISPWRGMGGASGSIKMFFFSWLPYLIKSSFYKATVRIEIYALPVFMFLGRICNFYRVRCSPNMENTTKFLGDKFWINLYPALEKVLRFYWTEATDQSGDSMWSYGRWNWSFPVCWFHHDRHFPCSLWGYRMRRESCVFKEKFV